jgi:hypothetical protein
MGGIEKLGLNFPFNNTVDQFFNTARGFIFLAL